MTPERQLELFTVGVEALGGSRSAARRLACSERTMARLLAGQTPLNQGWLRDISKALIDHADLCRAIERKLSPAFSANLVADQPREDGRRARWRD